MDGDTIVVRIVSLGEAQETTTLAVGAEVRVRYIGIDTPEAVHPTVPAECFGPEASAFNTTLVQGRTVWLELDVEHWDRYGRLLAYVYLDPHGYAMVNALLVAMGFATISVYPPNLRYIFLFEELENAAKRGCLGLWYVCQGICQLRLADCRKCLEVLNSASLADFEAVHGIGSPLG